MPKMMLIVDVPDNVDVDILTAHVFIEKVRECGYDYEPYTSILHCTLRPFPEKREENIPDERSWSKKEIMAYSHGITRGFNWCLEGILGEKE